MIRTTCRRSIPTRTSTKPLWRRRCEPSAAPVLTLRTASVVLGIDPGTAATGYGVVARRGADVLSLLECGVIRTSAGTPLPDRIREIYEGVAEIIERFHPQVACVENVFQGKNIRSALTLGHARGAILLAASLADLVIAEYSPREIKKAVVGNGNASKDQVGFMVKERLRLRTAPAPSDAADGVAAALCYCVMGPIDEARA